MNCPNCSAEMMPMTLDGHQGRPVAIDLCAGCQAFWFDKYESLQLAPGSTLRLLKIIGERTTPGPSQFADARCPRCSAALRPTQDMQRNTRFSYFRCPGDHGRFIRFFEFLREKNFIRPLSPAEIARLKDNVRTVTCSSCGAPIDLNGGAACPYCRAPLSMIDAAQVDAVVQQLKRQEAKRQEAARHPEAAVALRPPR